MLNGERQTGGVGGAIRSVPIEIDRATGRRNGVESTEKAPNHWAVVASTLLVELRSWGRTSLRNGPGAFSNTRNYISLRYNGQINVRREA